MKYEGYGPLRDLMADDTVNDILVNGPTQKTKQRKATSFA